MIDFELIMGNPGKEERVLLRLNIQETVGDVHGPLSLPSKVPLGLQHLLPHLGLIVIILPSPTFKEMQKEIIKIQGSTHLLIQWKEGLVWLILIFVKSPNIRSLCTSCQKFFGNPQNLNMCSVC